MRSSATGVVSVCTVNATRVRNLSIRKHTVHAKYRFFFLLLHELCDKYDEGDLSTSSLLRAASQIAVLGPSIVSNAENN